MIRNLASAALLITAITNVTYAQSENHRPVHIGFIYPISSNGLHAKEYTNTFSAHAIAGVSGGEEAFCASGMSNIIIGNAAGLTAAGFSNYIHGCAEGLQAAGFVNYIKEGAAGAQTAGFMNITGCAKGFQAAGFTNISLGNVQGAQAAGFFNYATNTNFQVAGFINKARNVNTQIAGFINIARCVKGLQLAGFINIAEKSDYPIGIVNIIRDGEKNIGLTIDEQLTTMAAFRSGGRVLYGVLGVGYNIKNNDLLYGLEAGLGAHIPVAKRFRINIEGTTNTLTDFDDKVYFKSSIRVLPSFMVADRWELFAGPSINFIEYDRFNAGLEDNYIWSTTHRGNFYGLSIGALAGIQFHL